MSEIVELMQRREAVRNVGVIAHIDHGKTTLTDSLLVGAGLLPSQVAGSARVLDYWQEEQRRGITMKTANISLLHKVNGQAFVVNLIDTPGHVDFAGKVTRALRAMDGAVVIVDAVEEVMAQTEVVTRQALQERVKPILFINKVDRLITEMKLSHGEIQKKLAHIIKEFNDLIETYGGPELKNEWKVDPEAGSVAFGSAIHHWGFTINIAADRGVRFRDIIDAYRRGEHHMLSQLIPIQNAVFDMIIKKISNPIESQKIRVPRIWKGDEESEIGRAMLNCDDKGPITMGITKIQLSPHGSLVATGRIFSGTIREGDEVHLVGINKQTSVDQVFIYMGEFREIVGRANAGNIAALTGLNEAKAGETIVDIEHRATMTPFEPAKYITEPVMAVAIEPKKPADLPKLITAMNKLSLEDPHLFTSINSETGQYLVRGVGELHLEMAIRLLTEHVGGIKLDTSSPIVTYRESISKQGSVVMVKSANKKNRFWVQVEPLEPKVNRMTQKRNLYRKIESQQINQELAKKMEASSETTRRTWSVDNNNILLNLTEGIQNLEDVKDEVTSGFHWACNAGPLCGEPLREVKAKLIDAALHEKVEERDSMQISRSISRAILGSCLTAEPFLLEPIYRIDLTVPSRWFGACTNIITRRRGRIQLAQDRGASSFIKGSIPVTETFGLSGEMRSATSGRAFWQLTFDRWQRVPDHISFEVIRRIRGIRGLPLEIPKPEKFIDRT